MRFGKVSWLRVVIPVGSMPLSVKNKMVNIYALTKYILRVSLQKYCNNCRNTFAINQKSRDVLCNRIRILLNLYSAAIL